MKKTIYNTRTEERFEYKKFKNLMEHIGAEGIISKENFGANRESFQVWYKNGVTIAYISEFTSHIDITLFYDNETKESYIERLILNTKIN